ncbi:leucine-rich repeat-containing protein 49 [Pycnococcus provasolii]
MSDRRRAAWHDVRLSPAAASTSSSSTPSTSNHAPSSSRPASATAARPYSASTAYSQRYAGGGFDLSSRNSTVTRARPGSGTRLTSYTGTPASATQAVPTPKSEYVSLSGARVSFNSNSGGPSRGIVSASAAKTAKPAKSADIVESDRDGVLVTRRSGQLYVERTKQAKDAQPERLNLDRRHLDSCCLILNDERLRLVNYQHNNIAEVSSLAGLPNLVFLDLYSNKVNRVLDMHHVPLLRVLMLGKNCLTCVEGLEPLARLDVLDLHNNEVSSLRGFASLPSLRILNLAGNKVASLAPGLHQLTSLTELNLRRNSIRAVDGGKAGRTLVPPALQRLFLSHNCIERLDDLSDLRTLTNLKELTVEGNVELCASWKRQRSISLRGAQVDDGVTTAILQLCPGLRVLDAVNISAAASRAAAEAVNNRAAAARLATEAEVRKEEEEEEEMEVDEQEEEEEVGAAVVAAAAAAGRPYEQVVENDDDEEKDEQEEDEDEVDEQEEEVEEEVDEQEEEVDEQEEQEEEEVLAFTLLQDGKRVSKALFPSLHLANEAAFERGTMHDQRSKPPCGHLSTQRSTLASGKASN